MTKPPMPQVINHDCIVGFLIQTFGLQIENIGGPTDKIIQDDPIMIIIDSLINSTGTVIMMVSPNHTNSVLNL
jgi:hypothetical protein